MPAQPGAAGPGRTQPAAAGAGRTQPTQPQAVRAQPTFTPIARGQVTSMRRVSAPPGAWRDGAGQRAGGPREALGRRSSPASRGPARWGTWQGGLGVCIIVAGAAVGTVGTVLTKNAPGFLLGLLVVAGTVAAALAVRPWAGWMIIPVPALSYLVAALVSGIVFTRSTGSSPTALALAAAQWVADGFFAMALATILAAAITVARWLLWRRGNRGRPGPRDRGWPPPAAGPVRASRRASRPYNFSSGA